MMTDEIRQQAVSVFKQACDLLASTASHQLFADEEDPEDDGRAFYWVGDEVGGIADFGDCDFLTPTEMVLIIEEKVTYDQYSEWRDALLDQPEGTPHINLHSWLMGARYEMLEKKD